MALTHLTTYAGTIAAVAGALAAVLAYLKVEPKWPKVLKFRKESVVKGLNAITLGVIVGVIVGVAIYFVLSRINSSAATVSGPSPTVSPASSPPSSRNPAPLRFVYPHNNASLGRVLTVSLTGAVPSDRHLWIFVRASGVYYVQGTPKRHDAYWSVVGVNLGSSAPSSAHRPYTIVAVLADSQANGKIRELLGRTHGNTGTRTIPGNGGAHVVSQITVFRN
jgi:hypothetical protein